jgi:hypothetical protein
MAVVTPTAFYYPEVLPAYGVAAPVLLGLAWRWGEGSVLRPALVRGLLLGLAASLLWCALYWHGTLDFLYRQVTHSQPRPNWYLYYQRYLWGLDDADWRTAGGSAWSAYGLLSAPVDLLTGALGLYFAMPSPGLPLAARMAAKAALAVFLAALARNATRDLVSILREGPSSRGAFLLSALACGATPILLALLDRLWQAGKLLSMITPLVFLFLAIPLVGRRLPSARGVPALLLVLVHLGFGLYRPVAARHPDGILYSPPYPSAMQPGLKRRVSWDLEGWQERLSACRSVSINVQNAVVYAYAEMLLSETGISWVSARPVVSYTEGRTLAPGDGEGSSPADCQILDSLRPSAHRPAGSRFLWVGRVASVDSTGRK